MLEQTKINLAKLEGGELQQLAGLLLPRFDKRFSNPVPSGLVEGTASTRKGSPDIWVLSSDDEFICIESTRQGSKKKPLEDFYNNVDKLVKSSARKKRYVIFVNFEPQYDSLEYAINKCKTLGIEWDLFNNSRIADILDRKGFHDLRKEFLGIDIPAYIFQPIKIFEQENPAIARLFEKGLIYFLDDEEMIIREMCKVLKGLNGEPIALLRGHLASGKSVIAYHIAKLFLSEEYSVLYLKLNSALTYNQVFPDILEATSRKTLLIFDDCHSNSVFINEFHINISPYLDIISCLLISRSVDEYARESEDDRDYDYVKIIKEDNHCYSLDTIMENQFGKKIVGIVQKRKLVEEKEEGIHLEIGNEQVLLANVRQNLFLLDEAMSKWNNTQPLSNISYDEILRHISQKYFRSLTKDQKIALLQMASLGIYEIKYQANTTSEESCKTLRQVGLCYEEPNTSLLTMPHSAFASLLVDAYSIEKQFESEYRSKTEFLLTMIRDYIKGFRLWPINMEEVFLNLFSHREKSIFVPLIKDASIQNVLFEYYSSDKYSVDRMIDLLYKTRNFLTANEQRLYVRKWTLDNHTLKSGLFNSEKPLLSYVKLLKTVHHGNKDDYRDLLSKFNEEDHKTMLDTSGFEVTCYALHSLHEVEKKLAKDICHSIDIDVLENKAISTTVDQIFRGLRHLKWVDYDKTIIVLESISKVDEEHFNNILGKMRFEELAESLTDLNRIDAISTGVLLNRIPKDYWISSMQGCSLSKLTLGLSYFKDANATFAQYLLELLDNHDIQNKTINCWFSHLGNSLAELNKINPKKASEVFKSLDNKELVTSILKAPFANIGKGLSELSRIDKSKASEIFLQIDGNILINKIKGLTIKNISKALKELNDLSPQKTSEILTALDIQDLAKRLQEDTIKLEELGRSLREFDFIDHNIALKLLEQIDLKEVAIRAEGERIVQIGQSITEINSVDKDRSKAIYYYLDQEKLVKKIQKEKINFQQLGTLVQQLKLVETSKNQTLLLIENIGNESLNKIAKTSDFEKLTAGLYGISKLEKEKTLARKILSGMNLELLIKKASEEQFEKFCNGILLLWKINKAITENVVRKMSLTRLVKQSADISLDRLANCLSNIAEVDSKCAKSILKAHGFEKISIRLNKLNPSLRKAALWKLKKVDPYFVIE